MERRRVIKGFSKSVKHKQRWKVRGVPTRMSGIRRFQAKGKCKDPKAEFNSN